MKGKVSVFKSRSESQRFSDSGGAAAPAPAGGAPILLGGGRVVEREGSVTVPTLTISHVLMPAEQALAPGRVPKSGFPSTQRRAGLGTQRPTAASAVDKAMNEDNQGHSNHSTDIRSQNTAAVLAMRPEEVEAALQELGVHFSPASLAFLQKRGEVELQMEAEGTAGSIDDLLLAQGKSGDGANISSASETLFVAAPADPQRPRPVAAPASSPPVRPRVEIVADTAIPDMASRNIQFEERNSLGREEFGIDGEKFVARSDFVSEFTSIITADTLFAVLHRKGIISFKDTEVIAYKALDAFISIGYCIESVAAPPGDAASGVDVRFGDLSFDDLDSGASGTRFSLSKACEFMRAAVPSKRRLGMRVLSGALKRRELLMSAEAYGPELLDPHRELIETEIQFMNQFESIVGAFMSVLSPHLGEGARAGAGPWAYSSADVATIRIRRLLVYALMKLCASDFPKELAYVQYVNVKQKSVDVSTRLSVSLLLRSYLTSPLEELAAEQMWRIPGWSAIGTPALCIPHARRSELLYGDHAGMSERKWRSHISPRSDDLGAGDLIEDFALQYRWNRLATALSNSSDKSYFEDLAELVVQGASIWTRAYTAIADKSREKMPFDNKFMEGLKIEYLSHLEISIPILDVFTAAARSGTQGIEWLRRLLAPLLSSCGGAGGAIPLLYPAGTDTQLKHAVDLSAAEELVVFSSTIFKCLSIYKEKLWELLAEISRSHASLEFHHWMKRMGIIESISACASQLINSSRRATNDRCLIWGLRCWRMCLVRGVGLDLGEPLLLLCCDDSLGMHSIVSAGNIVECIQGKTLIANCILEEVLHLVYTMCESTAAIIAHLFSKVPVPFQRVSDIVCGDGEPESPEDEGTASQTPFYMDETCLFDQSMFEVSSSVAKLLAAFSSKLASNQILIDAILTLSSTMDSKPIQSLVRCILTRVLGSTYQPDRSGHFPSFLKSIALSGHRGMTLCDAIVAAGTSLNAVQTSVFRLSPFALSRLMEALQLINDINLASKLKYHAIGPILDGLKHEGNHATAGEYKRICLLIEVATQFEFIKLCWGALKHDDAADLVIPLKYFINVELTNDKMKSIATPVSAELEGVLSCSAVPCVGSVAQGLIGWITAFIRQAIVVDTICVLCNINADLSVPEATLPVDFIGYILDQLPSLSGPFALIAAEWTMQSVLYVVDTNDRGELNVSLQDLRTLCYLYLNKQESKESHKVELQSFFNAHLNIFCPRFPIANGPLSWLRAGYGFERDLSQLQSKPRIALVWKYKICRHLHGQSLVAWLTALLQIDSAESRSSSFEGIILFHLLELALPECSSWLQLIYSDEIDGVVEVYTKLIQNVCRRITGGCVDEASKYSRSCGLQIVGAAHDRFRTPSDLKAVPSDPSFPAECYSSAIFFFNSIIDGCEHEYIHRNMHAVAATALLLPSLGLPWRAREAVWRRLGESRLLHLLEPSKLLQEDLLKFFSPLLTSNRAEVNSICFALSRLRHVETDLTMRIVLVGLFQIVNYIFEEVATVVEGPRMQLLVYLLEHSAADGDSEVDIDANTIGGGFPDLLMSAFLSTVLSLPKLRSLGSDGGEADISKYASFSGSFERSDFDSIASIQPRRGESQSLYQLVLKFRPALVGSGPH